MAITKAIAVAGVAFVALVAASFVIDRPAGPEVGELAAAEPIECRRILPVTDGDTVVVEPRSIVTYTYEIKNPGTLPLKGLTISGGCRCQLLSELPELLLPGQACRLSFRVSAPEAGTKEWSLALATSGRPQPLAELSGAVRTTVAPPFWVREPLPVVISAI
jgi:hypothetical protein